MEDKWYEQYPKLSHIHFTAELSARRTQQIPGWRRTGRNVVETIPGWKVLGYTLDAPYTMRVNAGSHNEVGVMFESEHGDRTWMHFDAENE